MNKGNKILLGVLAFVVACVVGYALFSESITISGSASAKGDFDISATCIKGVDSGLIAANDLDINEFKEGGYKNDYCNVNGNNVSFGADLEFPSATRFFTIILTNNGTIPAKLNLETGIDEDITVCLKGDQCMPMKDGLTEEQYEFFKPYYFGYGIAGVKNSSGNYVNDEAEITKYYNEDTGEFKIDAGESLAFISSAFWHETNPAESETKNAGDYKTIGTINFNFVQATD